MLREEILSEFWRRSSRWLGWVTFSAPLLTHRPARAERAAVTAKTQTRQGQQAARVPTFTGWEENAGNPATSSRATVENTFWGFDQGKACPPSPTTRNHAAAFPTLGKPQG